MDLLLRGSRDAQGHGFLETPRDELLAETIGGCAFSAARDPGGGARCKCLEMNGFRGGVLAIKICLEKGVGCHFSQCSFPHCSSHLLCCVFDDLCMFDLIYVSV